MLTQFLQYFIDGQTDSQRKVVSPGFKPREYDMSPHFKHHIRYLQA